ncbi:MAG: DUF960 family protein [Clostridium sp.]|uniref:DUF960 family protein n=1 Tax=Clostridium sp. TaxID=1506 RepID=UPI0029045254|nr:DUF960 family protein [Clostridium sp.]MDU2896982.1 DUF960 family protein [Clostridium sp.]MDU3009156.1 DUF960 family protein [Clostridium sp.]MDU3039320.1 DUF960 family protein [Clostridium sp.]MDU3053341.1 DUF960 family protein [Clostridium sp.]
MFKQENRYVSRQVNEVVPIQLQILMWSMIDSLKEKKKLDYLQIFRLKVKGDKVLIEHEQEVLPYKEKYEVEKAKFPIGNDMKIYVIDSVDYSTMIFAEEY